MPRQKKKRKPKSQRGKGKKAKQPDSSSALSEALDILGLAGTDQPDSGERKTDPSNE